MKRLLQELKEYKAASIKAPLFMIGEVGLELALPVLMAYIIDNGGHDGSGHAGYRISFTCLRCDERQMRFLCFRRICKKYPSGHV